MKKRKTRKTKKSAKKQKPIILINFKCYEEGTAHNAVKLAKVCETVAKENTHVDIILAVQAADIFRVSQEVSLRVFAQHIDAIEPGPHTGHTSALTIKEAGAAGTLLNHSEKRLTVDATEDALREAKYHGLDVVVCASDTAIGTALAELLPDMIAIEPPELIGGNVSVSTARPETILDAVKHITNTRIPIPVLVGAGITNSADVKKALDLGAAGVLVSSHIVRAKNPEKVLRDLVKACKMHQ